MRVCSAALAADEDQMNTPFGIMAVGVSYHECPVADIKRGYAAGIIYDNGTGTGRGEFSPEYPVEEIIFPPLGGKRYQRHSKIVTAKIVFCKK
jgi:hypothetical protein